MNVNRKLAAVLAAWTAFYPVFFEMAKARAADKIVTNAQEGQNAGADLLGGALNIMPDRSSVDAYSSPSYYYQSDVTDTNGTHVLVKEILPGADPIHLSKYSDTFMHPNSLENFTKQEMRNLKGVGCEQIHFENSGRRLLGWVWPIKKERVETFDPVTGAMKVEYKYSGVGEFLNNWIYLDGQLNLKGTIPQHFPTIPALAGNVSYTNAPEKDVFIKQLTPTTSLFYRWVYSPFPVPNDGSYFVYDHTVYYAADADIKSGKNLKNRYHFSGRVLPDTTQPYVAFYGTLYRVVRNYLDPDEVGMPCPPPYPPGNIIDGVDIINGGVDFSDILTNHANKIYNQGVALETLKKSYDQNYNDPYSAEMRDIAAQAAGFSDFGEISKIFDGCTEDPNIQWGSRTAHEDDIYTCTSIREDLMEDGCNGERKTNFSFTETRVVLKVSAEWLGRDCDQEATDLYDDCTTNTCPDAANSAYDACLQDCDAAYTTCIDDGGTEADCTDAKTSCTSDCESERDDALGACPANCAVKRDEKRIECEDWNAANVGPYDMTGREWSLHTSTVGGQPFTDSFIEDIAPGQVKFTTEVTPYGGSPLSNFSYNHQIIGATGSVTHYGDQDNNWQMTGTATANGSEFTVEADIYAVHDNYIDGCNDYLMYLADGMCVEWHMGDFDCSSGECLLINPDAVDLNCLDDRSSCTTLDGVDFCDGSGPASGVAKLLPRWGWEKMALRDMPDSCSSGEEGPPVKFLPQLCWKATGGPLDCSKLYSGLGDCWTDPQGDVQCVNSENGLSGTNYSLAGYKDDCDAQGYPARDDCRLVATNVCKDCAEGIASGTCYAYSIEWDCGVDMDYQIPTSVTFTQSCSSTAMRCMGTECHNPGGEKNDDMLRAMAALEMLDHMRSDLICEETGAPPTSDNAGSCTIRVFNGKKQTCKVPIGHQIGLTPNCCEEGAAAAQGVDALAYLQLIYYTNKLGLFDAVIEGMGGMGVLPGLTETFEKLTGMGQAISQTLLPAESPLSGLTNELEKGWAQMLVDNTGVFGELVAGVLNDLASALNSFLAELFDQAFADSVITAGSGTQLPQLGTALTVVMYIYLVYQILKILGHLIFKCSEDELKLGIERKVGNCHYVGDYCAKDSFLGCVQSNDSFCCFSSPLARIIHEQARMQGVGAAPSGKRKGYGSAKHPRCKGFTLQEMGEIDWDRINLDEWMSRLQDAGIHPSTANPNDFIGIGP